MCGPSGSLNAGTEKIWRVLLYPFTNKMVKLIYTTWISQSLTTFLKGPMLALFFLARIRRTSVCTKNQALQIPLPIPAAHYRLMKPT